ncbi:hypothetical protein [Candidatus Amarolinea aalborgensis]|uniref:hypothetical protein n=1 Tax=Candidatus Amarolinea aalborgensis TaxID=2249329 RepID=UPI003BFA14F6
MTTATARLALPTLWARPPLSEVTETALPSDPNELARLETMLAEVAAVPFAPLAGPLAAALAANGDRLRGRVALAVGAALHVAPGRRLALAAALETLFTASQAHEALPRNAVRDSKFLGGLVLMGDHLFAQAAAFAAQAELPAVVMLFAQTLQTISQAQVRQQLGRPADSAWTANAALCAAAAVGAGLLGHAAAHDLDTLHEVGLRVGRWADSHRLDDLHEAQVALRQVRQPEVRQRLRGLLI